MSETGGHHGHPVPDTAQAEREKIAERELMKQRFREYLKIYEDFPENPTPEQQAEFNKKLEEFLAERRQEYKIHCGWKNDTATVETVQGVELLMSTGSPEFYHIHRQVSELYDAAAELSGRMTALSHRQILEALNDGADGLNKGIDLYPKDENGDRTSGRRVDLYDYAHMKRMKRMLESFHPEDLARSGITEDNLEEKYNAHEPLIIKSIIRGNDGIPVSPERFHIVDLWQDAGRPVIDREKFKKEYYQSILENQPFLQAVSTFKDKSIAGHHSENGGHVFSDDGINGEILFLPVSPLEASRGILGEAAKTSDRFRAEGHPHEFGHYEENTGICVKFDDWRVRIFRGKVIDQTKFDGTNGRVSKNLLALNSQEASLFDAKTSTFWFGRKDDEKTGKTVRRGNIYKAMHNNYDEHLKEVRGYGLTELEAGDKILTDLIGVHFAVNSNDWIMNFGKETGMWTPEKAMKTTFVNENDEKGLPKLVFYGKLPPGSEGGSAEIKRDDPPIRGTSYIYGKLEIHGITALANYLEWRRQNREIPGISTPIPPEPLKSLQRNVEKSIDSTKSLQSIVEILTDVSASNAVDILGLFDGNATEIPLSLKNGETVTVKNAADLKKFFVEYVKTPKQLEMIQKVTGKKEEIEAIDHFIKMLSDIVEGNDKLTRDTLEKSLTPAPQDSSPQ